MEINPKFEAGEECIVLLENCTFPLGGTIDEVCIRGEQDIKYKVKVEGREDIIVLTDSNLVKIEQI